MNKPLGSMGHLSLVGEMFVRMARDFEADWGVWFGELVTPFLRGYLGQHAFTASQLKVLGEVVVGNLL